MGGGIELRKGILVAFLLLGTMLCSAGVGSAHFTMVFPGGDMDVTPEDYIAELGQTETVWILWGHPYEHILFDMEAAPDVHVMKPDGTVQQLTPSETIIEGHKAYTTSFTVDQMGDFVVYVRYASGEENLIDNVKAVIHCGEEMWTGWDAQVGQDTEILPYMRPYGMEAGFVFAGKALYSGSVLSDAPVEVEKYHVKAVGDEVVKTAESMFPYDAPMVFTRVAKTNDNGEFLYTLDEPGIWFVCAAKEVEGGPDVRGVFIVPVLEPFPPEEQVSSVEAAQQGSTATSTAISPGFGALMAIAGVLAVLFIAVRRR